ncbi:MAG: ankyrin repeat domain-containing protein, partial [Flavisolibacter sp.]|nr:ankyrin repeat domain-containing protein [Flavisolibacter sp.]
MSRQFNRLWVLLYTLSISIPFLAQGQIDSGLMEAIQKCDVQALQQRLNSISNINAVDSNGANALMWAVYYCDVPVVKQLVKQGAKVVDKGVIYVDVQNDDYYTSLQGIAADKGKLELLQYLADSLHLPLNEKEYDPYTQKKDSWTPLYWAINGGQTDVVRYLLKKGADVHFLNEKDGSTPLILAALSADQHADWAIFDLLMKEGGKEKLGEKSNEIIQTAAELSKQGSVKGDWNKDLALQQLICQLRKIYFGENHFVYAASLNHRASLYQLTGRYEKALPLYEQAKAIAKSTKGAEHRFYAGIIHNLAYLYKEMGLYEKALPYLE